MCHPDASRGDGGPARHHTGKQVCPCHSSCACLPGESSFPSSPPSLETWSTLRKPSAAKPNDSSRRERNAIPARAPLKSGSLLDRGLLMEGTRPGTAHRSVAPGYRRCIKMHPASTCPRLWLGHGTHGCWHARMLARTNVGFSLRDSDWRVTLAGSILLRGGT